jgi:hypothetical protein
VALTDCPECGRQISTLAAACPHCGYPAAGEAGLADLPVKRRGPSRWTDPGFWVILIGLIVVIVMSVLILRHFDDDAGPGTTVPATTTQAALWVLPAV